MKSIQADELAFANQQLAGMLRSGIPLEGALRQLCSNMDRGRLREELQTLEKDLSTGVPLTEAISRRQLPEVYKALISVGQASGDLPGTLILLADHYQRISAVRSRLFAVMIYPVIVVSAALGISLLLWSLFSAGTQTFTPTYDTGLLTHQWNSDSKFLSWVALLSPVLLGVCLILLVCTIAIPTCRRWLEWRLPGFREARLAQIAEMFQLLLSRQVPFHEAVELISSVSPGASLRAELQQWQKQVAGGVTRFDEVSRAGHLFPPLFVWCVCSGGESWAQGFGRAADLYARRAHHRTEMILHALFPIATLTVGFFILMQVYPILFLFIRDFVEGIGGV